MREFHEKAMLLIMTHMITGSPLLWPVFPLVVLHDVISISTRAFIDGTVSAVSRRVPSVDLFKRRVPSVDLFKVDALSRPASGRSGLFAAG